MIDKIRKYAAPIKRRVMYYKNWSTVDFSELSHLVIFLGSPRSGTTLVRTIIDAHPNAVIGNEVHILRLLRQGKTWQQIIRKICLNHDKFKNNPFWTDYNYQINGAKNNKKNLKIIGDKRSLGTIKAFVENPAMIKDFLDWSALPVKIIRCVRHPFDVIATKHWRNKKSLDWNIDEYFFAEKNAEHLVNIFKPQNTHHIYHEQLVQNPDMELRKLLTFLELEVQQEFITACKDRINPKSNLSRWRANWQPTQIKIVEEQVQHLPHLQGYLKDGQLVLGRK
jgi:hypothetical protein